MPKIVPVKNVASVLVDIKAPKTSYARLQKHARIDLSRDFVLKKPASRYRKKFIAGSFMFAVLIMGLLGGFFVFQFRSATGIAKEQSDLIAENFQSSLKALAELDPETAHAYLSKNTEELKSLEKTLQGGYIEKSLALFSSALPVVKDGLALFGAISELNMRLLAMTDILGDLHYNGFSYFQKDGKKIIQSLAQLEEITGALIDKVQLIKNKTAQLKTASPVFEKMDKAIGDQYVRYGSDLFALKEFLGNMRELFAGDARRHILLLFQNPSEIRPGGGFIGSYADLTVQNGQMINLDVRDIYDPDGQLSEKTIPPEELQSLTRLWGARDANWFFDFPSSARAVLHFLEKSKIYSEQNTTFDGALALNIKVIESLLAVTGPMDLEGYGISIGKDNFLREVQREVESGNDKKAGEPKRILKVLTPILLERLNTLSSDDKKTFLEKLKYHLDTKDIMMFAKPSEIQSFFVSHNVGGEIYELPQQFWGNYIAIVNANIAGGKSDAVMEQNVAIRIDIDTEGGILNDLKILRRHRGNEERDPWWRADNKDFLQIFTNPGVTLISLQGNNTKSLVKNDYTGEGFNVYPALEALEKTRKALSNFRAWTFEAFGKTIFGTWLFTKAGETKTIEMRYELPATNASSPEEGKQYTFIFERQSGVKNSLHVTVAAPIGFEWVESQSPLYSYETDDPPSRVLWQLTLRKK